jgi:ribulose-phosphate 3-epimerase
MIKLAPSILTADFANLGAEVRAVAEAGADWLHIDVMDGRFVPNLTMGPLLVASLRPHISLPIDAHLMVENADALIPAFVEAGADFITVHVEACPHLHRTVQHIKQLGAKAGVALNPATPLIVLEDILPDLDLVLLMSVNPGFGGQTYITQTTAKIARLRQQLALRELNEVEIQVDGGIKAHNIGMIAEAGATVAVVGSAVFNRQASVAENIGQLRAASSRRKVPNIKT